MKSVVFLALVCLPDLAQARCVTAADLASGIAFTRQDGHTGLIKGDGDAVAIDYAANSKTAWTDQRSALMGIYETGWTWVPTDDYYVGGGPGGGYRFKLGGTPPLPAAGTTWTTRIKVQEAHDDGTESGGSVQRYTLKASYSYQPVKDATLSGCSYKIMPVEATFTGSNTDLTRRWIYFPDLGFGLETRVTNHLTGEERKLGLTALTPN